MLCGYGLTIHPTHVLGYVLSWVLVKSSLGLGVAYPEPNGKPGP